MGGAGWSRGWAPWRGRCFLYSFFFFFSPFFLSLKTKQQKQREAWEGQVLTFSFFFFFLPFSLFKNKATKTEGGLGGAGASYFQSHLQSQTFVSFVCMFVCCKLIPETHNIHCLYIYFMLACKVMCAFFHSPAGI